MSNGDLERRVIELEEYIARIPARWASIPEPKISGWAKLKADLLRDGSALATPEGTSSEITIIDGKSLIGEGKRLPSGSNVYYAENINGLMILIQSTCPVDA